ncbi:MAG: hypothetical protein LBC73_09880 [Oscillospiraceae bacterium]|nr:hypothetical protein [Oscillospiraceae bacterium]
MKTLNDYMNDSSVINEPMPLREVHAIRLMLNDRTKDMTVAERTVYYNRRGAEAAKKYGFKIVNSTKRT